MTFFRTASRVRFLRTIALGGALLARMNGCAGYLCYCPNANARGEGGAFVLTAVDGAAVSFDYTHSGACSVPEAQSGCVSQGAAGGPLSPPEIVA